MTRQMPPEPTAEMIANGQIFENQQYEFKGEVDFSNPRKKSDFVDDVVAFLNAGSGYLVIGVEEDKKKGFKGFHPLNGSRDEECRAILSRLQDTILPVPLNLRVDTINVDGGFLLRLAIPEHRMRPYQNRLNGAFYIRTGQKNTPLSRDQVRALFKSHEDFAEDLGRLLERETATVETRDFMQNKGAMLHLGILPREFYELDRPSFDTGGMRPKCFPSFHYGSHMLFKACENGVEAKDATFDENRSLTRLFVGDDWFIHCAVAHPVRYDEGEGRPRIFEFKEDLTRYMRRLSEMLDEEGIFGCFCVALSIRHIGRSGWSWKLPGVDKVTTRPALVERVDDPSMLDAFFGKLER
ncbi:AlbA family DNA-binding domain-containing protein [Afifella marina]|uniref:Putative DNA-binding domain-containing protein n=1 Tax=Afifella marina DSM 2698 TaxID=1120955 RepID=A0A1G5MC00_AFIMA|nr:ATP-binding protein [Afifella marina]MBK1622648.1 ATP-binding protein [Afifella marina DSM 2698]MBK1625643.1 ATP-binding protein [Afifella marina]MBK5917466.1 hypothetical protein [Afifella marina]RAI23410.1 hypothetical protein CH311_00535 [Afifella marina DSM 2698]SCZ22686.1 Putative DNA-binding domain-containing protein [Afifella marina DSM 2698]